MKRLRSVALLTAPGLLLLSACGSDPTAHARAAAAAIAGEDYGKARAEALAALEAGSEDRALLHILVRSQLALGDGDGAQSTVSRLQAAGESGPALARLAAEAALLRGQTRLVFDLLGNDGSPDGWRLRAAAHLADNANTKALDAFRRGMAAGGDYLLARDFARYQLGAQDTAGADATIEAMLRLGPDRLDTLMLAGERANRRSQLDEAVRLWSRAAERYRTRVEPLLALANAEDTRGRLDPAIAYARRAAAIAPADARVRSLTVQLASEKGDWAKVRDMLAPMEADLDARSSDGLAYAEALLRLGHPEQARARFAKALSLSPQNPYARMMLAEAQLATGDGTTAFRTARPLADSVLAGKMELDLGARTARAAGDASAAGYEARLRSPLLAAIQQAAAEGQAAMGRHDWLAAVAAYRRVPGFDSDAEVLRRVAFASSNAGLHDDAIALADRALQFAPRNPDMLHVAGLVRLNAGRDRGAATRLIEQASELDPANPVFRGDLARASASH